MTNEAQAREIANAVIAIMPMAGLMAMTRTHGEKAEAIILAALRDVGAGGANGRSGSEPYATEIILLEIC